MSVTMSGTREVTTTVGMRVSWPTYIRWKTHAFNVSLICVKMRQNRKIEPQLEGVCHAAGLETSKWWDVHSREIVSIWNLTISMICTI